MLFCDVLEKNLLCNNSLFQTNSPPSPCCTMSIANPTVLDKSPAPAPQGWVGDHLLARVRESPPAPAPQGGVRDHLLARDRESLAPAPQGAWSRIDNQPMINTRVATTTKMMKTMMTTPVMNKDNGRWEMGSGGGWSTTQQSNKG